MTGKNFAFYERFFSRWIELADGGYASIEKTIGKNHQPIEKITRLASFSSSI